MSKLILIGVDNSGLNKEKQALLASCQAVFTTERFRPLLNDIHCPIHEITPVKESLITVEQLLGENKTVGMLASGDPLFYGIGQVLINRFGKDSIEIHPALSSMQLAFARIKKSWQDAYIVSLHGRNTLPGDILEHETIFLFTDKHNTPAEISRKLLNTVCASDSLQETDYLVYVLENLGMPEENITSGTLSQIAEKSFSDLNVMIILSLNSADEKTSYRFGLTQQEIQHSRGLITKDEVRAIVLHKLKLPSKGVFWDIGSGSGSISVEAARLNPMLNTYSVERNPEEQSNIAANCNQYCLTNISLIKGMAPDALQNLPNPDRVFIGGSGGNLERIISHTAAVLAPNGRVVVTAVTETTREAAPRLLHENGFTVEISEIQVTRRLYPDDEQSGLQLNPITIITGKADDR